jgi:uncharacterized membrane protein
VIDAVLVFAPAVFLLAGILLVFGPDPSTSYDREYEESPPTDTPPALVPPLLRRANTPEENEFTATLFDLVRRGYFTARPVGPDSGESTRERVDLELARGDARVPLSEFELPVARIFDGLTADGPLRLSEARDRVEANPEDAEQFSRFRELVKAAVETRGWYTFTAARVLLLSAGALLVLGMVGSWLLYSVSTKAATFYFGAATIEGAGLLFHASWITKLVRRRRRTPAGQLEARRWEAFKRYLSDFPRLGDAPPGSFELWEQYLVYAIAFGLARRVIAGASLYRLDELSRSPIFWLGLREHELGSADLYSPARMSR